MDIERLAEQLQIKINHISSSLQNRYQKIQQKSQEQVEKSTFYLNIFFGLGLLADIVSLAVTFFSTLFGEGTTKNNITILLISGIIGTICLVLMFNYGIKLIKLNRKDSGTPMQTVDAVIVDKKDRIILIKRKFQPFKGEYALPGGFTELAEDQFEALVRETREETGVDLKYGEWEYIGVFDKKGRDPRGPVITNAYLCKIDDIYERTKGYIDEERLVIVNLTDLKNMKLAFDHRDIINKALKHK
jgi:8-oxo-dGTP diphosphatase